MQQTVATGGEQTRLPYPKRTAERFPQKGTNRTNALPDRIIRTGVLTLSPDLHGKKLRKRIPPEIRKIIRDSEESVLQYSQNFAKQHNVNLKTKRANTYKRLITLQEELLQIDKTVKLFWESEEGNEFQMYIGDDGIPYGPSVIDLYQAYEMPRRMKNIVLSFTKTIAKRFNMYNINETCAFGELEAYCEYMEMELDEEENKEEKEIYASIKKDFLKNGGAAEKLKTFKNIIKPLTREEAENFIPRNNAEKRLKQVMLEGFDIMKSEDKLENCLTPSNEEIFAKDGSLKDPYNGDGIILFSDLSFINYNSNDDMTEALFEQIDNCFNSGAYLQELTSSVRVNPDGTTRDNSLPIRFMKLIMDWENAKDSCVIQYKTSAKNSRRKR